MQSIDSIETYAYETSKDLVSETEEIKCSNIIKRYIQEISGNTNSLFNLIIQQPDIDKIYPFTKKPYEVKYRFLISKRESSALKYFIDSKVFIEYSSDMDNIYKNIEEYSPNKKRKILIVFVGMIPVMLRNKKNLIQQQLNYLREVEN